MAVAAAAAQAQQDLARLQADQALLAKVLLAAQDNTFLEAGQQAAAAAAHLLQEFLQLRLEASPVVATELTGGTLETVTLVVAAAQAQAAQRLAWVAQAAVAQVIAQQQGLQARPTQVAAAAAVQRADLVGLGFSLSATLGGNVAQAALLQHQAV